MSVIGRPSEIALNSDTTVVSLENANVQAPGKTGENREKASLLAETGVGGG